MNALIEDFKTACDYPGKLDAAAVEAALAEYLKALGITRKIVRLEKGWTLADHPTLKKQVDGILEAIKCACNNITDCFTDGSSPNWIIDFEIRKIITLHTNQPAIAAIGAYLTNDARKSREEHGQEPIKDAWIASQSRMGDATTPLTSFIDHPEPDRLASLMFLAQSWSKWIHFDLSRFALTYTDAVQTGATAVMAWSKPLYDAFLNGGWLLHWTDDTLYWVAEVGLPQFQVDIVNTDNLSPDEVVECVGRLIS